MSDHNNSLAEERVLSTLNRDGSRRWLRPRPSNGRFYRRRMILGWTLLAIFLAAPHLHLNNKPLILLDLPKREFTFFGLTLFATDTVLLVLFLLPLFLSIFLFTALLGRVWCGWACPQTVYMEFLFRPLERLIEGSPVTQRNIDKIGHFHPRRLLKYFIYLVVCFILANTFVAYFVGTEQLWVWMRLSPFEHPTAFVVMAVVTAFIFFDFSYFREQTCLVACPYGRFQSVLLDRQSLRVAYDYGRGEPRSKIKEREPKQHADKWGDCIDCRACVMTCPTGVDIRDGLQMECVHCTQCIDACDAVMERVKKPRGLVRYTSQEILEGQPYRWLRFRVIFYPALIVVLLGILSLTLAKREPADIVMLHGGRVAYRTLPNGNIANQIDVRITNRTDQAQRYKLTFKNPPMGMNMIAPLNPLSVAPRRTGTSIVFITSPPHLFRKGGISIRLQVDDGKNFSKQRLFRLLGPPAGIRN